MKSKNVKLLLKSKLILLAPIFLLISCDELSESVEGKFNEIITSKTEQLDSLVNREINNAIGIDSVTNLKDHTIRKMDSLVDNASSRFDSVTNEKIESLKSIRNNN